MKLVFVHGAPAVGKLTIAKALLRIVPGRLHDNHAAIDLARTVFDFGAPGFWELVQTIRCSTFEAAAAHGLPLLITTFCYVEPDDRPAFEAFDEILGRHGGQLLPVFLYCSPEEAVRRVANADRVERRKMTSPESLIRALETKTFTAVPRPCLKLDTGLTPAETNALQIARHFGL